MSSAARSSILGQGRQAWRSLYELVDTFSSKVSPRQNPINRLGPHQSTSFSSIATPRLSKPPWSFPRVPKYCGNNVRRSFTSSGLLLIGLASPCSTTSAVTVKCSVAADSVILGSAGQTANIGRLARQAWVRDIHTTTRRRVVRVHRRTKTSKSNTDSGSSAVSQQKNGPSSQSASSAKPNTKPDAGLPEAESTSAPVSKYFHLPTMPHLPHRPTKEEFLAAANGFWERLKVRFKWFSIRSMRPWNIDEWGAFVSWFLFGHLVWILVGTTTFFSLGILFINTVFAQGKNMILSEMLRPN